MERSRRGSPGRAPTRSSPRLSKASRGSAAPAGKGREGPSESKENANPQQEKQQQPAAVHGLYGLPPASPAAAARRRQHAMRQAAGASNMGPDAERSTLAQEPPETPSSILKKNKPSGLANICNVRQRRRVSFAPAEELETMHLYEVQSEESSPESDAEQKPEAQEMQTPPRPPLSPHQQRSPRSMRSPAGRSPRALGAVPPFSPAGSRAESDTMSFDTPGANSTVDITDCSSRALAQDESPFSFSRRAGSMEGSPMPMPRDLTADLPDLATLAEEDERQERAVLEEAKAAGSRMGPEEDNVTANLTQELSTLASFLQQGNTTGGLSASSPATMDFSVASQATGRLGAEKESPRAAETGDLRALKAESPFNRTGDLTNPMEVDMDITAGTGALQGGGQAINLDITGLSEPMSIANTPTSNSLGMNTAPSSSLKPTPTGSARGGGDITMGLTLGYSKIWEQGAHPTWGSEAASKPQEDASQASSAADEKPAAEEEEAAESAAAAAAAAPAEQAQRDRWGLIPGQEDTMDLNLGQNARCQMGDATWHHIYGSGSSTGEFTRKVRLGSYLSESPEEFRAHTETATIQARRGGKAVPSPSPAKSPAGSVASLSGYGSGDFRAAVETVLPSSPVPSDEDDFMTDSPLPDGPEPLVDEEEEADRQSPRPMVLSPMSQALALPLPGDDMPADDTAMDEGSGAGGSSPTGRLDAGATTRLLADTAQTPSAQSRVTVTPQPYGISEPLVPLSLSGGSRSSADALSSEKPVTAGATTHLLAEGRRPDRPASGLSATVTPTLRSMGITDAMVPLSLSGGSKTSYQHQGNTTAGLLAESAQKTVPKSGIADKATAQPVRSPFGIALTDTEDSPLFGTDSPTQRLQQFGKLPTPSRPPAPASRLAACAITAKAAPSTTTARSRSGGLEALEGTFQDLAGQLQALKPKAGSKRSAAPQDSAGDRPAVVQKLDPKSGTQQSEPGEMAGEPKLGRTLPQEEHTQPLPLPAEEVLAGPDDVPPVTAQKLARTPPDAAAAEAPAIAAAVATEIPGGPKLARTPPGQSYAGPTLFNLTPVQTPVIQQQGQGAFASPAPAPFGLYAPRTPAMSLTTTALPIDFKTFLNLADVRFLDRLRRGTSGFGIGESMARAPPPEDLRASYELMCVTTPDLEEHERRLMTLNAEVDARKTRIAEKERRLAAENPPLFARLQLAPEDELQQLRESAQALKGLCRARSQERWKQWRHNRELEIGKVLQENHLILQQDREFAEGNRKVTQELTAVVQGFVEAEGPKVHAELVEVAASAADPQEAVEQRTADVKALDKRAQGLETTVEELRSKLSELGKKREILMGRYREAKTGTRKAEPLEAIHDVLDREERLSIVQELCGWNVEGAADSLAALSSGEVLLRCGGLARMKLQLGMMGQDDTAAADDPLKVAGVLEIPPLRPGFSLGAEHIALAARVLTVGRAAMPDLPLPRDCKEVGLVLGQWTWPSPPVAFSQLQELFGAASRLQCLLDELSGLRLACPALSSCKLAEDGQLLSLRAFNLDTKCLLTLDLSLTPNYPDGRLAASCEVLFGGAHNVSAQSVLDLVEGVPPGYRRLERVCKAVGQLISGQLKAMS